MEGLIVWFPSVRDPSIRAHVKGACCLKATIFRMDMVLCTEYIVAPTHVEVARPPKMRKLLRPFWGQLSRDSLV